MRCKYETSNGRCGLKGCYAYRHKCFTEDLCKCCEPQTNADRIRAMSDEELAEFLCHFCRDCIVDACPGAEYCNAKDGKANGLVKWLRQPVKDGEQ